jgi:hypothetical protein
MSVYWKHDYQIQLGKKSNHQVIIYDFSPRLLFLQTSDEFSLAFKRYFEETGGDWNSSLKLDDGQVHPGWLFSKEKETVDKLFPLLKKIHTSEIPPIMKELENEEEMKKLCNKILSGVENVFEMVPVEKDVGVFPIYSKDGKKLVGETIFYFNREDDDKVKGDCVVKFQKGKKTLEIYQFRN